MNNISVNIPVFVSMLFCLQLLCWMISRRSAKKMEGKEDYFLAGKNVTFFPLMMTFLATQVGGDSRASHDCFA